MTPPTLRQRLQGLAATLVVLILVIGMPLVLIAIGARPWDIELSELRLLLSRPDDGTLALTVIAWPRGRRGSWSQSRWSSKPSPSYAECRPRRFPGSASRSTVPANSSLWPRCCSSQVRRFPWQSRLRPSTRPPRRPSRTRRTWGPLTLRPSSTSQRPPRPVSRQLQRRRSPTTRSNGATACGGLPNACSARVGATPRSSS